MSRLSGKALDDIPLVWMVWNATVMVQYLQTVWRITFGYGYIWRILKGTLPFALLVYICMLSLTVFLSYAIPAKA